MKRLLTAALLLALHQPVALGQTASGQGRGNDSASLAVFGDALLKSFDFSYMVLGDRHIRAIKVDPDSSASQVKVGFYDKNFDDPYRWSVTVQSFSDADTRDGVEAGSCRGVCTRDIFIPRGYTFALTGFDLEFASSDHHIDQIGIYERNGRLTIAYNDKNNDDLFRYEVRYVLIPTSKFSRLSTASGTSAGSATATIPRGNGIIRGFNMNYRSKDHHVLKLGVKLTNGRVTVNYADKNSDDSFTWFVDYGLL